MSWLDVLALLGTAQLTALAIVCISLRYKTGDKLWITQ